jgi:hypothetical protein
MQVIAGRDLRIDQALVHTAMASLDVLLSPPMSKGQRPWRIVLRRLGQRMSELVREAEGLAAADGTWSRGGLQPDRYVVTVIDGDTEVAYHIVELHGGREQVSIAVSTVDVSGRVVSGDDGVEAIIQFNQIDGISRRAQTSTDKDGRFEVTLPVPGEWRPSLYVDPNGAEIRLPPVTIRSPHVRSTSSSWRSRILSLSGESQLGVSGRNRYHRSFSRLSPRNSACS